MGFVEDFVDTFTGGPQRRAEKQVRKMSTRDMRILDRILEIVRGAEGRGQFDPERRIQRMEEQSQFSEGLERRNQAAVARTLGFSPGDSEPLVRDKAVSERFRIARAAQRDEIRRQTFFEWISALQMALQNSGGAGIAALAQIANRPTGMDMFLPAFMQFQAMKGQGGGGGSS